MAIQSYSWFRTTSQSAYAQIEERRQKLHTYNQEFLDASATLTDNLFSIGVTQSTGMATIVAKIAAQRIADALQAKLDSASDIASSVDLTV